MMALCVSLTACSEDEENENGGGGNGISGYWGKYLQYTEKDGEQGTLDFTYDHQGRIVKAQINIGKMVKLRNIPPHTLMNPTRLLK